MLKRLRILLIGMFLVLTMLFGVVGDVFAQQIISQNDIYLSSYRLSRGELSLEGFARVNSLRFLFLKDGAVKWHDADLEHGMYSETIFLDDLGMYDVFIIGKNIEDEFVIGPRIKVNHTFERNDKDDDSYGETSDELSSEDEVDDGDEHLIDREKAEEKKDEKVDSQNNSNNKAKDDGFSDSDVKRTEKVDYNSPYQSDENLDNTDEIRALAKDITSGSRSEYEKAKKIYDWVWQNISYDRQKYSKFLRSDYSGEHGAQYALENRKGVCYDYASLVVELANAVGLEARMIKGYYTFSNGHSEYHAWNEVYIPEKNRWISLDASYASVYGRNYFDSDVFGINYEEEK